MKFAAFAIAALAGTASAEFNVSPPTSSDIPRRWCQGHSRTRRAQSVCFWTALSMNQKEVEQLFIKAGPVLNTKLIKFADTGRCKGQAYITFQTQEGANKALKLSGTTVENKESNNSKEKATNEKQRTDLKLKVTKALNRIAYQQQRTTKGKK
jgi:RNA recognition motif-containing protein